MQINIHESDTSLKQLVEQVIAGEEIIIGSEAGKPVAKLVPYAKAAAAESEEAQTLADFLSDYIGILSSSEFVNGGAHMSENSGKKFTEGLLKKREEGRL